MKRPYTTPSLVKFGTLEDLPLSLRAAALQLLKQGTPFTAITARDHRWVSISEPFATLLGYGTPELIGHTVDEFTSPGSIDVESAFDACFRLGESEGMWLFDRRNGSRVLVNYHARVSDQHSFAQFRPLLITETWAAAGASDTPRL